MVEMVPFVAHAISKIYPTNGRCKKALYACSSWKHSDSMYRVGEVPLDPLPAVMITRLSILSPLVDPEVDTTTGPMLPTKGSDEFKPFIRRLPKFKFWFVFWPILLCYWVCAARFDKEAPKIMHMINYKYIPFGIGKQAKNMVVRNHLQQVAVVVDQEQTGGYCTVHRDGAKSPHWVTLEALFVASTLLKLFN
ncbi:hypothetical protein OROMI_004171 [Orobanche minor]